MTPEKQELIIRMENLLNMPYNSNPYFKTSETWRASIINKLKELKNKNEKSNIDFTNGVCPIM